MTGNPVFDYVLIGVFVAAVLSAASLKFIDAPYGRHTREGWGPKIPTRLGWVLMESPAALVFAWFFFSGNNYGRAVPLILFVLWQLHYVHRSFLYPFQIRVKPNDSIPIMVVATGSLYCAVNGYLNGSFTSTYGKHLNDEWLKDPRFIMGVLIFGFGYWLNKKSDSQLKALRAQSTEGYQIPYGYGFKYVSMPNYLGEILTWSGFALASWSLASLSFVAFTMANLIPRAVANHKWYLKNFESYPKDRKALIPYVL